MKNFNFTQAGSVLKVIRSVALLNIKMVRFVPGVHPTH